MGIRFLRLGVVVLVIAALASIPVVSNLHSSSVEAQQVNLVVAAHYGTATEVMEFLDRGADPNTCDTKEQEAPTELLDWVKRLFHGRKPTDLGPSLLQLAALNDRHRYDITTLLLERGADLKLASTRTPDVVVWAARSSDLRTVRLLVEHGADVNDTDVTEITPLMGAVVAQDRASVKYLLEHGAHVITPSTMMGTSLSFASERGDKEIIRMLKTAAKIEGGK